jgi:RNA polymerase sigma-70 factor (ECF subfamily)
MESPGGADRTAETSLSFLKSLCEHPNEESWRRFVDLYAPLIRGWLCRYQVAAHDADDLAQEVMTVVVRELPQFKHNEHRGAFRTWLRVVAVNQLRALWRSRRGELPAGNDNVARMLDLLADDSSSLSQLWNQQHDQHVANQLMTLIRPQFEPQTWEAFRRTVLDNQKPATVAAELGMTVNAVLLAKCRVMSRLRREMRGWTNEE